MPIYEYDCQACGRRTEAIQRLGEDPLKICPHCGGALKKAFSAPAIQFKGSGWYVTDYARAKRDEGGTKKKSEETASDAGAAKTDAAAKTADTKTEKKTETKTEKKGASEK